MRIVITIEEHSNYSQFCLSLLNLVPEALTTILSSYLLSFYPMELEENSSISQQKEYLCKDFLLTNNNLTITELTELIQVFYYSFIHVVLNVFKTIQDSYDLHSVYPAVNWSSFCHVN